MARVRLTFGGGGQQQLVALTDDEIDREVDPLLVSPGLAEQWR
jgi:hypothetical protein